MRVRGSCRQADSFGSGQVQPVADQFHEDCGFGGSCEKFREGIAEGDGDGDDLFGGGQSWPNGAHPGAEESPDQLECGRGKNLKQALGDEPELDVSLVGRDLAADGVAVGIRLVVRVLVAANTPKYLLESGNGSPGIRLAAVVARRDYSGRAYGVRNRWRGS